MAVVSVLRHVYMKALISQICLRCKTQFFKLYIKNNPLAPEKTRRTRKKKKKKNLFVIYKVTKQIK